MKIVLHTRKINAKTRKVIRELKELIPASDLYATSDIPASFKIKKSPLAGDIIIAIGGDGTTLSTERNLKKPTPILPIHTGQVGFIAEIGPKDLKAKIPLLLKNKYKISKKLKAKAMLNGKPIGEALNEISVISCPVIKTCVLQVKIDGKKLGTFESDGVIVATPTGSTAYCLSVGGPIVDPKTNAFVVAHISPYTLKARPLVFDSSSKAEVKLLEGKCYIAADGKKLADFSRNDTLVIQKSGRRAKVIRFGEAFYNKLDTLVR